MCLDGKKNTYEYKLSICVTLLLRFILLYYTSKYEKYTLSKIVTKNNIMRTENKSNSP